jgi:hypothetical protein
MEKFLNKSENIRKATEAYKNDPKFTIRSAAIIYHYAPQSIINRLTEKHRSASDIYTPSQRFTPVEKYILIIYISQTYRSSLALTIQYLNNFVNEFLLIKGDTVLIGIN